VSSESEQRPTLIVGATGSLGTRLMTLVPGAVGTSRSGSSHETLDITDPEQVSGVVGRLEPSCVINTAAMTSVDGCEHDPETATRIHVDGTANLVSVCESAGSRLIHLSTNYVFDGADGPYAEEDSTNPLSVYGRTKLESEEIVHQGSCAGLVLRTAVFYGPEGERPNFVTWAIGELAQNKEIRVVTDEWANPTYVPDLAEAIHQLTAEGTEGVLHLAGPDYFTRYEMVMTCCDVLRLDRALVHPIQSADLGQDAARPPRAGLKTDAIRAIVGEVFRPFAENLQRLATDIGDVRTWATNRR